MVHFVDGSLLVAKKPHRFSRPRSSATRKSLVPILGASAMDTPQSTKEYVVMTKPPSELRFAQAFSRYARCSNTSNEHAFDGAISLAAGRWVVPLIVDTRHIPEPSFAGQIACEGCIVLIQ